QQLNQTLNALQNKLDPEELMDVVWGYLRRNRSELSRSLVETVKANPVPILLLGAGVSWLALGDSVTRRSRMQYGDEYAQSYDSNLGYESGRVQGYPTGAVGYSSASGSGMTGKARSEEHTSELQSRE